VEDKLSGLRENAMPLNVSRMSGHGTNRTSSDVRSSVALGGRADVARAAHFAGGDYWKVASWEWAKGRTKAVQIIADIGHRGFFQILSVASNQRKGPKDGNPNDEVAADRENRCRE
jgi:hypothetical protein